MKKRVYKYSSELMNPPGSIHCNRRNPVIALKERQNIIRNKKAVESYVPPDGINCSRESYVSYDKENVLFYRIEKNIETEQPVPCIIYFHGGGFMMPLQTIMLENAAYYATRTGYKVMLPEYRYAPHASCSTTIEDCFHMVLHMRENHKKYGIDPGKIILYGESAGGALAAGIAHLMRDRKVPQAAGQMLIYPATDYHYEKYGSMEEYQYAVWPKKSNIFMWKYYLKGAGPRAIRYAAPMNMDNFKNLPPAYVEPQEMDVMRDEGIGYAKRLENAGCSIELKVIPASYHGFDSDHTSPLVQRVLAYRCKVMKKFCEKLF